jgi:hypothetical protein
MIGCKRGTLKAEMVPIRLCLQIPMRSALEMSDLFANFTQAVNANKCLEAALDRRERDLTSLGAIAAGHVTENNTFTDDMKILIEFLPGSRYSPLKHSLPAALTPLNECVLAIVWELQWNSTSRSILKEKTLEDLVTLLRSAAKFQADTETVSNILHLGLLIDIKLT